MKLTPRLLASGLALSVVSVAQAHPGHDGHELTWDLDHLAAHPGATLLCFSVIALGAWTAGRLIAAVWRRRSGR